MNYEMTEIHFEGSINLLHTPHYHTQQIESPAALPYSVQIGSVQLSNCGAGPHEFDRQY